MRDDEQTEEESYKENWALEAIIVVLIIVSIYGGTVWFFTMSGFYVD
jgi:hypothetical protein